jgi:hypothetical protein
LLLGSSRFQLEISILRDIHRVAVPSGVFAPLRNPASTPLSRSLVIAILDFTISPSFTVSSRFADNRHTLHSIIMDRQIEHALLNKKPVPEIDFTLHVMEDGTQVSTRERVCKGNFRIVIKIGFVIFC